MYIRRLNNQYGKSQYHKIKTRNIENKDNHHASRGGFTFVARPFIPKLRKLGKNLETTKNS